MSAFPNEAILSRMLAMGVSVVVCKTCHRLHRLCDVGQMVLLARHHHMMSLAAIRAKSRVYNR